MKRISVFNFFAVISALFIFSSCYSSYPVVEHRTPPPPPREIYSEPQPANSNQEYYSQPQPAYGYQEFYSELSPYGDWVNYNGNYAWVPRVESGFQPYDTNGHWVNTQYGWTWASDYRWGWAAFHYGRWAYEPVYGWMWNPGNTWGPAWVSWRQSSNYYGWAPLGPSVSINFGGCPADHYVFVQNGYMDNPHFHDYVVDRSRNTTIINNTTVINNTTIINNNTTIVTGPSVQNVEQVSGRRISSVNLTESSRAGTTTVQNGQVNMYRPNIQALQRSATAPKPTNVVNVTQLRPVPTASRLTPTVNANVNVVNKTNLNNINQNNSGNAPIQRQSTNLNNAPQSPTLNTDNGNRVNRYTPPVQNANNTNAPINLQRPTLPNNNTGRQFNEQNGTQNSFPANNPNMLRPQQRAVIPSQTATPLPTAPQTPQQSMEARQNWQRQQFSRQQPNNAPQMQQRQIQRPQPQQLKPVPPPVPHQELNRKNEFKKD